MYVLSPQLELAIAVLLHDKDWQNVSINLGPVKVRHGHHNVVSWQSSSFFAIHSNMPHACTYSCFFGSVRCCHILSYRLHRAHITPCLTHPAQVFLVPFDFVQYVVCKFELPLVRRTTDLLLWSDLNQVACLVHFQFLIVTHVAGKSDVQPGADGMKNYYPNELANAHQIS